LIAPVAVSVSVLHTRKPLSSRQEAAAFCGIFVLREMRFAAPKDFAPLLCARFRDLVGAAENCTHPDLNLKQWSGK
jgi:hypothetical protein